MIATPINRSSQNLEQHPWQYAGEEVHQGRISASRASVLRVESFRTETAGSADTGIERESPESFYRLYIKGWRR